MVQPLIICSECKKIHVKYGEINNKSYCQGCYEKIFYTNIDLDFIAIDFEIANNKMSSACSLGMAFVKNNQIIDEKYFLIHPPTLKFDDATIKIHGLTANDVKDAQKFNEIWEDIKPYFNDTTIVAHNAQFDMSVLHSCLTQYSLELPAFQYIDSIEVSSRVVPGHIRGSLKERAAFFNIDLNDHHNAIADARACALIVISSIKLAQKESLLPFFQKYTDFPIKQFSNLRPQTHFKMNSKFNNRIDVSDITPTLETLTQSIRFL